MIYLDHNATTPVREAVIAAMTPWWREACGNPQSQHGPGRLARQAVDRARNQLRAAVAAPRDWEVIFTGSGTEADNLALHGLLQPGDDFLTSPVEHKAVLAAVPEGVTLHTFSVDSDGIAQVAGEWPVAAPRLVSLMLANNETGAIQPVAAVGALLAERPALLHCDAVQAFGRLPIDVTALGVDLISLSAHKIRGPKGVGALICRPGLGLRPLIRGGSHENTTRAGTHNVPGIVGFGVAAELAAAEIADYACHTSGLRDRLRAALLAALPWAAELAPTAPRLPNTLALAFPGCDTQTLLIQLDRHEIAAGAGAACSAGGVDPSHVTLAMGLPPAQQKSVVRFSLGADTTAAEVDAVIPIIIDIASRERTKRDDLRRQIYGE